MAKISSERAAQDFGIIAFHEEMANGERRFRLRKVDGTAYVRTESAGRKGWQNSHFHRSLLETYVVQTGWMAFAQLVNSELQLCICEPGTIITSRPDVVHNVYLPDGAVIHTVKHGAPTGEYRLTDARTAAFDRVTHALSNEDAIRAATVRKPEAPRYSEEYRHFDNLIWQVPAWSTGIFAVSIQGLADVLDGHGYFGKPAGLLLSILTATCLMCFAFVMMRFRTHQRGLKRYASTPAWFSASTLTQSLIVIEAMSMVGITINLLGLPAGWCIGTAILASSVTIVLFERSVRRARIVG